MLATNTSESETAEEKLRWAFKVYDKDSSGRVSCVNVNLVKWWHNTLRDNWLQGANGYCGKHVWEPGIL